MATAAGMHDRFREFLTSVDIRLRETEPPSVSDGGAAARAGQPKAAAEAAAARVEKWGPDERALAAMLIQKRAEVHEALCDGVDTGGALRALEQLLRETNRCARRRCHRALWRCRRRVALLPRCCCRPARSLPRSSCCDPRRLEPQALR